MKKIVCFLFAFLPAAFLFAQKTIAIKCGKLFDAKNGQLHDNQVIVVNENKITYTGNLSSFKHNREYLLPDSPIFVKLIF